VSICIRCPICDREVRAEDRWRCPACDAPKAQKTAVELVAEFTAGVAAIKGVFAAYAAEIARLKAAVAERDAALAFYDDDTDLEAERCVLDCAG
jgi:hypothetical protein